MRRPPHILKFLDTARNAIGTPFKHQGRLLGVGVDCIGLAVVCAEAAGIQVNDDQTYGRNPDGRKLVAALKAHCREVGFDKIREGDILIMQFEDTIFPMHVAIVSSLNPIRIIHAYAVHRKVVEHILDEDWRNRVVGVYRIRRRRN